MTSTFPKFSSKSRGGKPAEVVPPPHTIHNRGSCDIKIGPHTFLNTVIFEVHYQYIQVPPKSTYAFQPSSTTHTSSWKATAPYGHYPAYTQEPTGPFSLSSTPAEPISAETAASQKTAAAAAAPLLSSLDSSVTITPNLISQVNVAASSNPTLANLLQLAATGKALPEQLKTLGLLIQSLAGSIGTGGASPDPTGVASTSGQPQPDITSRSTTPASAVALTPAKEFDLVIEFSENPSDRWIFPRSPIVIENVPQVGGMDILLTTGLPFSKQPLPGSGNHTQNEEAFEELVTFCFAKASPDIWSCLSRWAGAQDQMEITRKAFQRLVSLLVICNLAQISDFLLV